jgi:hypothetical protein
MKTNGQECHHVGRETKRKSAPPDNHRQKNAQPNDPRNDPKKKPRMEGRRRDGMDERRKPPPKRGRESREGSEEKPKGKENPRHDRIERRMGPLHPDPAVDQYSPHATRMSFR